jgi:hypothetical protein
MCRASFHHRLKSYFKDETFFPPLDDGRETKEARKARLQNIFTIMQNLPLCFNQTFFEELWRALKQA